MKVLVACEFSGVVRDAFREQGHEAYSCDLLPNESKYHIQDDVLNVLYHEERKFDLMIAHPPCTRLCNSGVMWLSKRDLWDELKRATVFFYDLWNAPIDRICIENPIPHKYAKLIPYSQIIQPYQFGHPERKATCLWLKNLPKLKPTKDVKEEMEKSPKKEAQRIHYMSPGKDRWQKRSITFKGIAQAMAMQFGTESRKCN